MAARHDPDKQNRGYFKQSRASRPLPPLPPGYDWEEQIKKYSSKELVSKIQSESPSYRWFPYTRPSERKPSDGIKTDKYYRTELDDWYQPRKAKSNFNRLSGVFCHRGFYDQAMKIPENSFLAIDYGFQQYNFCLHELDVKLHTNADKSLNLRKAFLSHDATGARTTAQSGRWSQNDGRDVIGTILVTRGINLEKNDFASTFQETDAKLPGLDSLLFDYDNTDYDPGRALSWRQRMLAWFRYHKFNNLQVIIKGYNRFYPDGQALLEAVNRSVSLQSGVLIDTFRAHDGAVISAASDNLSLFSFPGPKRIVTSSRDKTVRIWEYHTSTLERTLVGHDGAVNSVVCSCRWVVSGSDDKTVRIWDINTGNFIHRLKGHKEAVNSVAFSARNTLVASASDDRKVVLWDAKSGKLRHTLRGHKAQAASVAFWYRVDQEYVVSGSGDATIRIWDTSTGNLLQTLSGHTDEVTSLDVSANVLATGSLDRTIRIWNTRTWELLHTFSCHDQPVKSLAFIGKHLASTSGVTVRIWEFETGKLHQSFQGHTAPVTSITFGIARGIQTMITTSSDGEVRIWAYKRLLMGHLEADPEPWQNLTMGVIMVFYPQPILDIALGVKGLALKTTTLKERLEVLDYEHLKNTTMEHIRSFIDNPIPELGHIIPEIVHCGLGLGYDTRRGTAVNPKDGSPISDPEVLLASRLDRAMIEVSLELRKLYPQMVFSSCTRLSDVYLRDSDAEYTADLLTGRHSGTAARHTRGLYPQSDLVVADDPVAEIAARTWIDESAGLDRAQLMTMTYDDWIAQNPAVKEVWGRWAVGGARQQKDIVPAAEVQGQREEDDDEAESMSTGAQREGEEGSGNGGRNLGS
ncbi:hypothetical protein TrVFT333_006488 [Trichoderma virens FT-333]|nr:hypothetical protein TrVFT333_006488 [Trichoderma virens FT-333]